MPRYSLRVKQGSRPLSDLLQQLGAAYFSLSSLTLPYLLGALRSITPVEVPHTRLSLSQQDLGAMVSFVFVIFPGIFMEPVLSHSVALRSDITF